MKSKITFDEKKWQAEDDARTMARYEEIMADSKRRNAAIKEARSQAADLNKRANIMNRVAGASKTTTTRPKNINNKKK